MDILDIIDDDDDENLQCEDCRSYFRYLFIFRI